MQIMNLFRLERWDGGDRHDPTKYYFTDKDIADSAKGQHDLISSATIVICEHPDDVKNMDKVDTLTRALAKLSDKEREMFGMPADINDAIEYVKNLNKI
jgi:hypothetical protein